MGSRWTATVSARRACIVAGTALTGMSVFDGGIMPTMVSANTNSPIMAISWLTAELILKERKRQGDAKHSNWGWQRRLW